MLKTRLGLPANLVAAVMFLVALFAGSSIVAPLLLAGYILLFEDLNFVRRAAVKAMAVLLGVMVVNFVVNLIPDFIDVLQNMVAIWDESFDTGVLNRVCNFLMSLVYYAKNVLLALLAVMALLRKSIAIKFLDDLADKK